MKPLDQFLNVLAAIVGISFPFAFVCIFLYLVGFFE